MREEEGCPFGQLAETGQHRSLDVPTPPFTGTRPVTSSNKVRHAASAAPLPAPARARTRFRQFPPRHALLLPLAHTACEHRISFSVRFSCTHAPSVGSRLACNWLLHSCLLIFLGAKGAEEYWQVIDIQRFADQGARQVTGTLFRREGKDQFLAPSSLYQRLNLFQGQACNLCN